MNSGFVQILDQFGQMWGNQRSMIDHAITQGPRGALINPVFRIKNKLKSSLNRF
jgi:hypothetical protein